MIHGLDMETEPPRGLSLRMALAGVFVATVLAVSGSVAFLTLRSSEQGATKLALRLHQETAGNIATRLDGYLDPADTRPEADRLQGVSALLAGLPVAQDGRALLVDRKSGRVLATSQAPTGEGDPVVPAALQALSAQASSLIAIREPLEFRFVVPAAQPLSRETWLARATPYAGKSGQADWLSLSAMPESYYLAEVNEARRRAAVLCALALALAVAAAVLLAALVSAPARRIIEAARAMARGELDQQVAGSRLAEMAALVAAFNRMCRQMQEAFRSSQRTGETLQGIFGASPVAMAVFRADAAAPAAEMRIADVNAAWSRTTGHGREDSIGQPGEVLRLWTDMELRQRFISLMRERGAVRQLEARMRRADGSEYPAQVSGQEVRVGSERFNVIAIDELTALKQASEQLQALNRQLGALLDAAVEVAVIATDAQARITVFNRGAERMLGHAAADMLGEPASTLNLAEDIAAQAQSGGARNRTLLHKDGRAVPVSMALSIVRDGQGEALGYLAIARDVSEQLAAQSALVELNTQLDRRVRERTQALEASRLKLEQALDHLQKMQGKLVQSEKLSALGHIVAAVAHELNTPIGNSVTVASTLLSETLAVGGEAAAATLRKQRFGEYVASMQSGTELLQRALQQATRLIDNFRRVADEAGDAQRQRFDLREVVENALALLQPMLRQTPYQLDVELPAGIEMNSDPGALEQVLGNLVSNAVVHGFAGRGHGHMRLRAEADGAFVRLNFSDDGKGMDADTLSRIYDPFFTTALGKGGSGLGLNISYKLVTTQLGGEIEAASAPGQGCRFTLTLPREAPGAASRSAP